MSDSKTFTLTETELEHIIAGGIRRSRPGLVARATKGLVLGIVRGILFSIVGIGILVVILLVLQQPA